MSTHGAQLATVEDHDGIALIRLNRPEARNAISVELAQALHEAVAECHSATVTVLTGADPAFCAGLDLKQLQSGQIPRLGLAAAIRAMPGPVIAAVNGPCVAGGLELALACDFVVASERAVFADTHARIGVYPGGGLTARLPRLVGPAFATYLSLCGGGIDAATALRTGLAVRVTPHADLVGVCIGLARQITESDAATVAALRAAYAASVSMPEDEAWRREDETARRLHASASRERIERTACAALPSPGCPSSDAPVSPS